MKLSVQCSSFTEHMGVVKAHIDEGINRITMVDLELASRFPVSNSDLDKLVGEPIKFAVEDVIDNTLHKVRFDGLIFEVINVTGAAADNDVYYYTIVMRPKLWHLNYYVHSRSYPAESRISVVDALLKQHGFKEGTTYTKDYRKSADYPVFNQLLQTGLSDLSFFKNLLIQSGINFYFRCDDDGEKEEILHLVDNEAFFPNYNNEIPIVGKAGMVPGTRRIEEITRLTRAVPSQVNSTGFLADGSVRPRSDETAVENAGTKGIVEIYVPEGLKDAQQTATHAAKITAEGFTAARVVYQGACNHIGVRAGRRISIKDHRTLKSYKILVTRAHHTFEQSVNAALSESGGGAPEYRNQFVAAEPMAPIHPLDIWTDVDTDLTLESTLDLDPEGKVSLTPKFKYVSRIDFNPEHNGKKNREAVKELFAAVSMLQAQVRKTAAEIIAMKIGNALGGGGLFAAEITADAKLTEGKELVCMVKAEQFQKPIVAKVSTMWHTKGGGTQHLPRKGNHVWITRVASARDNDWVVLGYRPTAVVAAMNPAGQTKIKQLGGTSVGVKAPKPVPVTVVPSTGQDLLSAMMVLDEKPQTAAESADKPYIVHVRLTGAYFDTNKCFMLPTAVGHIQQIKGYYDKYPNSEMLAAGHTDGSGDASYNETLSLERANAVAAYLKDDVEAWYAWYGDDKPAKKRWGKAEDRLMIQSLPDYTEKPPTEDRVAWFQRTRNLAKVDGIAGKDTRHALIKEYMGHDDTSLPAGINLTTLGCGENFPMPQKPEDEQAASDRHSDQEHRRVEFFFFKKPFGIDPPSPGDIAAAGTTQYETWCKKANERHDLELAPGDKKLTLIEMHDALFRTDSAVLMPEGEDPSKKDDHQSIRSVGLVASVLRYNEENPGKTLLVAGHCDTSGTIEFNQTLSEERAQVVLVLIKGGEDAREDFKNLCNDRHDDVDLTQIFDWVSRELSFDCKPSRTDAAPSTETIKRFQRAYTAWLKEGTALGEKRGPEELDDDGDAGPLTWGGIFDCYEYALKKELGEDDAGLADLRSPDKLQWLDEAQPWRGFSEHFPIDNLGKDNYRSQANRRVEVLFFDDKEEPNPALSDENSEMSDIYLPGYYQREHLGAISATRSLLFTLSDDVLFSDDAVFALEGNPDASEYLLKDYFDNEFGCYEFRLGPLRAGIFYRGSIVSGGNSVIMFENEDLHGRAKGTVDSPLPFDMQDVDHNLEEGEADPFEPDPRMEQLPHAVEQQESANLDDTSCEAVAPDFVDAPDTVGDN